MCVIAALGRWIDARWFLKNILRKLSGNSGPIFAGFAQAVAGGASFLLSIILIRYLGVSDFGKFTIGMLLVIITKNISEAVVLSPMVAIGGKLSSGALTYYRGFVSIYGLLFCLISGILVAGALYCVGRLFYIDWLIKIAPVTGMACFFSGISDFTRRKLFLDHRPAQSFIVELVRYSSQLIIIVFLAAHSPKDFDVITAMASVAFSSVIASIIGMWRFGNVRLHKRMNIASLRRQWLFIRWLGPSVLFDTIHTTFPFLFAGAYLGDAAVGVMRAAHQFTAILNLPFNALIQIVPVIAAKRLAVSSYADIRRSLRILSNWMVIFTTLAGVCMALVLTFLSEYISISDRTSFLILMLLFGLVNSINAARFADIIFLNTMEQTRVSFFASVCGAIIGVVGVVLFTTFFGIFGVALTFVAVACVLFCLLRYFANKIA